MSTKQLTYPEHITDIFKKSNDSIKNKIPNIRKQEFVANLRMDLNDNWKKSGNDVSIEYWEGYVRKLETILFELLDTKV